MLYELKQAPRAWYTRIDSYFTRFGFTKSEEAASLYHVVVEGNFFIIVIYVDDLILASDEKLIKSCKGEIKDMGLMHYFLGMVVWKGDGKLFVY